MSTYEAKAVANTFLDLAEASGTRITPMQIQKLVYLAHGWSLGLLDTPLINEKVQAWKFGPVIESLYHEFKRFGKNAITAKASNIEFDQRSLSIKTSYPEIPKNDEVSHELISKVWDVYGRLTGPQLSNLTHQPNTPWKEIFSPCSYRKEIPDDIIRAHYLKLIQERSGN